MQKWMQDAEQHGTPMKLYVNKGRGGGRGRNVPPPPAPDEALLTQALAEILTEDDQNILLTDGFIVTEGLDPITAENGNPLII